jgi:hypothetical protein
MGCDQSQNCFCTPSRMLQSCHDTAHYSHTISTYHILLACNYLLPVRMITALVYVDQIISVFCFIVKRGVNCYKLSNHNQI